MTKRIATTLLCVLVITMWIAFAVGGADEATFDLGTDVKTTGRLLTEMAWNAETPYPYGNWYGPGWWGGGSESGAPGNRAPVDALDAVAMRHDFAYELAEEQGRIHGPAEEQRLKAIADAIAVRDAKKLPADPRDWDPPAADPAKADRYRRRIGFGFGYLSQGRNIGSIAGKTYTAIKNAINGTGSSTSSGLTEADIDRISKERAKNWFDTTTITETYRIELSAPQSVLAEGESVPITLSIVPVSSTASVDSIQALSIFSEISLDVDGPGSLSSYLVGEGSVVTLTAKKAWFFSNVGSTINVEGESKVMKFAPADEDDPGMTNEDIAEGQNYVRSVQILAGSIDFKVAIKTTLTLSASPKEITSWPAGSENPCREVELVATVKTDSGKAVAGIPITFTLPGGGTASVVSGDDGSGYHTLSICQSDTQGEVVSNFTYTATCPQTTTADGNIYFPASASTSVRVENPGPKTVRGIVVDAQHDNRPVSGATVKVEALGETKTATTGDDGRFTVEFDPQEDTPEALQATVNVTKQGYESSTTSGSIGGNTIRVALVPESAVLTVIVRDAESGERIDGAIVRVTQPFSKMAEATNGQVTLDGFYVGDTVTLSAGGFNHKTVQRTGKITLTSATTTFNLPVGEGETTGGDLETTGEDPEDLPSLHTLRIWASPANPGPGEAVVVTAQIFPPDPGIPIKLSITGTDGYSNSIMSMTNALGQATLYIPGGGMGVIDRVIVQLVGESVMKRLNYTF